MDSVLHITLVVLLDQLVMVQNGLVLHDIMKV